jgi:hypothetical protein
VRDAEINEKKIILPCSDSKVNMPDALHASFYWFFGGSFAGI